MSRTLSPTASATDAAPAALPVTSMLRLEGALAAAGAIAAFYALGYSWWLFGALILAPDLAMLGFLAGPRVGAWTYNLAHTYLAPAILAAIGYATHEPLAMALAAIWAAHIGVDRVLGYGLKLGTDFKTTHLSSPAR